MLKIKFVNKYLKKFTKFWKLDVLKKKLEALLIEDRSKETPKRFLNFKRSYSRRHFV